MSLLPGFCIPMMPPAVGLTVPSGLVSYWPLDTDTEVGGTSEDIIGGNHATLVNTPVLATGQIAQGYDLVGADNDFLASAASQGPQSALSVSCWTRPSSIGVALFLAKYSTSNPNAAYLQFFFSSDGSVHARIVQTRDTNYIGRQTPASTLAINTWYHLIVTWSGGTANSDVKIYVNASQADNANDSGGSFTAPYSGSDLKWILGSQFSDQASNTVTAGLNGVQRLDDMRVYDRELSSSEVTELYNAGLAGNR